MGGFGGKRQFRVQPWEKSESEYGPASTKWLICVNDNAHVRPEKLLACWPYHVLAHGCMQAKDSVRLHLQQEPSC